MVLSRQLRWLPDKMGLSRLRLRCSEVKSDRWRRRRRRRRTRRRCTGAGDGDDAGDDGPVSLAETTTTPDSEAKTKPLSGSEEPGAPTLVWGRAQAGGAKQAQPRSSERRGAAQAGAAGAAEHFHTSEGAGARDKQRAGEKLAKQVSGERGNNEGEPRVRWLQLH